MQQSILGRALAELATLFLVTIAMISLLYPPLFEEMKHTVIRSVLSFVWRTCNTTMCLSNNSCREVVLYIASGPLRYEGYKNKRSTDFLNRSAIGMLFNISDMKGLLLAIDMNNVSFPLVACLYKAVKVCCEKIELVPVTCKRLEPGKIYLVENSGADVMVEYDTKVFENISLDTPPTLYIDKKCLSSS